MGRPSLCHFLLMMLAASVLHAQQSPSLITEDPVSTSSVLQTLPPRLGQEDMPDTLWQTIRVNMPTYVADLRDLVRYGGDSEQMSRVLTNLQEELDEFSRLAEINATEEFKEITAVKRRAELLMDYLAQDYDVGSNRQLLNSLRLLEEALNRMEELAFVADRREGRSNPEGGGLFPPDWQGLRYGDPAAQLSTTLMNAAELTDAIDRRRELLNRSSKTELRPQDEFTAREIGEMARALVLRQGELPPLMRPGFRNSALRMEVISENLIDYLNEKDRANYRRQLMFLDESIEKANSYLKLHRELSQRSK